jgi:hypothetical protein
MTALTGSAAVERSGAPPVDRPATWRVLWIALLGGVAFDLGVRSGIATVGGAIAVGAASAGLLASGRVEQPCARVAALLAPLFGFWLLDRASNWLVPLNVAAVLLLLGAAAAFARDGDPFDVRLDVFESRLWTDGMAFVAAPTFLRPLVPRVPHGSPRRDRAVAVARGVVVATPVIAVLGTLLASADAVFASIVRTDIDGADVALHIALLVVGAWGLLGLLRVASTPPAQITARSRARLGTTEANVVLGAAVALYSAFVITQAVVAAGGAQHVMRTAGLTYAEHARSGYVQLLVAVALTGALVLGLRGLGALGTRTGRVLAIVLLAQTVIVLVLAMRRLGLYVDVFGLTMLRLYSAVFAVWIAAMLAALAVRVARPHATRAWLPGFAIASGLVLILALDVANPEAVVARHNLTRQGSLLALDAPYVTHLSDDAVPTVVSHLDRLPRDERALVLAALCAPGERDPDGWAAHSLARSRADDARVEVCVGR